MMPVSILAVDYDPEFGDLTSGTAEAEGPWTGEKRPDQFLVALTRSPRWTSSI